MGDKDIGKIPSYKTIGQAIQAQQKAKKPSLILYHKGKGYSIKEYSDTFIGKARRFFANNFSREVVSRRKEIKKDLKQAYTITKTENPNLKSLKSAIKHMKAISGLKNIHSKKLKSFLKKQSVKKSASSYSKKLNVKSYAQQIDTASKKLSNIREKLGKPLRDGDRRKLYIELNEKIKECERIKGDLQILPKKTREANNSLIEKLDQAITVSKESFKNLDLIRVIAEDFNEIMPVIMGSSSITEKHLNITKDLYKLCKENIASVTEMNVTDPENEGVKISLKILTRANLNKFDSHIKEIEKIRENIVVSIKDIEYDLSRFEKQMGSPSKMISQRIKINEKINKLKRLKSQKPTTLNNLKLIRTNIENFQKRLKKNLDEDFISYVGSFSKTPQMHKTNYKELKSFYRFCGKLYPKTERDNMSVEFLSAFSIARRFKKPK